MSPVKRRLIEKKSLTTLNNYQKSYIYKNKQIPTILLPKQYVAIIPHKAANFNPKLSSKLITAGARSEEVPIIMHSLTCMKKHPEKVFLAYNDNIQSLDTVQLRLLNFNIKKNMSYPQDLLITSLKTSQKLHNNISFLSLVHETWNEQRKYRYTKNKMGHDDLYQICIEEQQETAYLAAELITKRMLNNFKLT